MFWRIWIMSFVGLVLCSAGVTAIYYAHEHRPAADADRVESSRGPY